MHLKDVDETVFIIFIIGKIISELQADQETNTLDLNILVTI